jgi:hypothetical protein
MIGHLLDALNALRGAKILIPNQILVMLFLNKKHLLNVL